jgi:hypothetical protein
LLFLKNPNLFNQNCNIFHLKLPLIDLKDPGEDLSSLGRTTSSLKHEINFLFILGLLGNGSGSTGPLKQFKQDQKTETM